MKAKKFWGGFVDGRLDLTSMDTGFGGFGSDGFRLMPAIFVSKTAAREQYQDVREVEVCVGGIQTTGEAT